MSSAKQTLYFYYEYIFAPNICVMTTTLYYRLYVDSTVVGDEGQVEERGPHAAREGERGVLWAGQATSAADGHHEPAGQGVHYPPLDQLPQDAQRLPGRWVNHAFKETMLPQ